MKQKIALVIISLTIFKCAIAEGQDGLGTFIIICYVLSIIAYTVIGGSIFIIASKILKPEKRALNWIYFALAFLASLAAALIFGDNFIPFFWFE